MKRIKTNGINMEKKLIQCNNCGMKVPKEVVSIECPGCYKHGFDNEKKKIIEQLNKINKELRLLPNRDDEVHARILMPDGGGVNRFVVMNKIEDLINDLR